ncbi:MAG: DNA repair protein RecN [Candidatus Cryptobacteroides sp.]
MLKSLNIKNYVLIDSLDIEFPAGLVIITGQTGAGKSIILGALSLVLGSRADASVIGSAGDNCVVEAEFTVRDDDGSIASILAENDMEFPADPETGEGSLVIRRVLGRNGRSRSFINDDPVPVKLLTTLAARLIDIHSQHETMLLRDKAFQMSLLDHYASASTALETCRHNWAELSSLRHQYSELCERLDKLSEERDYIQARYRQLESASLKAGELEDLETEQKRLANAEEIKTSLCQVENLFGAASADDERPSLNSQLKDSARLLEKISAYIPSAGQLAERIESSRLELDDVLSEVMSAESGVEVSDVRLQQVDSRLSLLYELMQKFGCSSVEDLISVRDSLSESLSDTSALEERKEELADAIKQAERKHLESAEELHQIRSGAIKAFAGSVCSSIRSLELDRAVFDVRLEECEPGSDGKDSILFVFSSTGQNPVDVAKCASGGEMSRIMLCLKAMMAEYTNMPAMIFDEIDTGVSGSVADKMGSMICSMGAYMQVFAITHLPQVAAKGDAHYIVTKTYEGDNAVTSIRKISGKERVDEIARLLSGSTVTPEAVANATALLNG